MGTDPVHAGPVGKFAAIGFVRLFHGTVVHSSQMCHPFKRKMWRSVGNFARVLVDWSTEQLQTETMILQSSTTLKNILLLLATLPKKACRDGKQQPENCIPS